ncbi:MAG: leucine-rich repeat domain-containing protein, partial [Malacoplasma sp.]|nr:leucine-rich repeat domain-containing protein [Malacoplasma sp.]
MLTSSACFLGNIVSVCLKDKNALSNTKITDERIKKIDAKLIGANHGTIDVKFIVNECTILAACSDFLAAKNFNFNGGKFIYEKVEYTITEIWHDAFSLKTKKSIDCYFQNCNLTIPSTIKKVGDFAFVYNYRRRTYSRENQIIGINFEEGVEEIGEHAFEGCEDIKSKKISFPNSIKYIGKNAFQRIEPLKELDLSALDHVIEIKHNPFDKKGCLWQTEVNAIRVKDEDMKEKYCSDKHWSSAAKYFVLKDHIFKTINSKYIGGDSNSTFDFNYLDPKQAKITGVSSKFTATGNFNFNGGKFSYDGTEHVISEMGYNTFHPSSTGWYFKECNLTIPSTIKKISDRAFYGNSRNTFLTSKEIISINFNEGLEDIGEQAFYKCNDLESDSITLPNSLKHIGNGVFGDITALEELDLTALDHVINIDTNPFSKDGCLYDTNIKTIWVKDQAMKDKYCN